MTRKSRRGLWKFVSICLFPTMVAACLGCRSDPTAGSNLGARPTDPQAATTGLESSKSTKQTDSIDKSSGEPPLSDPAIVVASAEQTLNHSPEQTSRKETGSRTQSEASDKAFPIDLPTALRLAGANNLQIRFAQHRLSESLARLDGAEVLWLPSISAGPLYNKHDGRIQDTRGDVIEVSRNAAFIGGGPVAAFHLADAIFEPLAARQLVRANQAAMTRTMNDIDGGEAEECDPPALEAHVEQHEIEQQAERYEQ